MQETALAADMPKHLVSVKWDKPDSRFDGVVHSVPFELVDYTEEKGRVIVWWPKRAGEKKWEGHLVDGEYLNILYYTMYKEQWAFILRDENVLMQRMARNV